MANETILVVDDSREIVRILKEHMLTPLGYQVIHGADGRQGLDLAVESQPDLILLDMNMPHMTGMEMLQALRQTDCVAPVIFMTMHGSESVAVEAFRLGVRNYLMKPFTAREIQQAVDDALRATRLAREKEALERSIIETETVRQTTVTLAHYINNYLTSLISGLSLLEEDLEDESIEPDLSAIARQCGDSAAKIGAVMRVLQRVTNIQGVTYHGQVKMIDIETALQEEFTRLSRFKSTL